MRTFQLTTLAAACAFAMLAAVPASAQPASTNVPPPKLERLDEGEAPAITIRQPTTASEITEKRAPGGELKEIKVKSGASTYYLRPRSPSSVAVGDNISTPQWVIHEFGGNQPKDERDLREPQALQPAPKK